MTRSRILGALAGALSLVAALAAAPSPALAAEGQIDVSVPTTVPCVVKHDGTVVTPSNWEMRNVGSEEVSLGTVSVTPHNEDEAISLSATSSVAGGAESQWFSYENGFFSQAKTGETLDPGASVSVDWSVGDLDAAANASTLEAAANGEFALAKVDFSFGQKRKQAFAVRFSDGTAGLYKRLDVPSKGDIFNGRTVTKVVTGIEDEDTTGIFYDDEDLKSVTAVDEGIRPKTTLSWFNGCSGLTEVNLAKLDTSGTTNMGYMFNGCQSLASLDVSGWNVSNVTDASDMFRACTSLRSLTFGAQWTKNLAYTSLPSTLYSANGTPYALSAVPLGEHATYYTKAEYVPQTNHSGQDGGDSVASDPAPASQDDVADAAESNDQAADAAGANAAGNEPDGSVPNDDAATSGNDATSASTGDAQDVTALAA